MKKYGLSIVFIAIRLISQTLGSGFEMERWNPYMELEGRTGKLLQQCSKEQGEYIENDCFDTRGLSVTKEERDRKFIGKDDYPFPNPSQHPYQTLIRNLKDRPFIRFLDGIQGMEDEDLFRAIGIVEIKGLPIKAYKEDLKQRFNASEKQLQELTSASVFELKREAMKAFIDILKDINSFSYEGCRAHKVFPTEALKFLALGKTILNHWLRAYNHPYS